jgi:hypothetical protein
VRRSLLLAGALLAAAAAMAAALLASDARDWQRALDRDDALLARGAAPAAETLEPKTTLPFSAAERILGVRDDVELREALSLFRQARRGPAGGYEQTRARGAAEAALGRIAQGGGDPRQASMAATLLGVLAFEDALPRPGRLASSPERALAAFQTAIRLDPANAAAKDDLELVLRVLLARATRAGSGSEGSDDAGAGEGGASSNLPGTGY